jgi:hypothetical protein
MIDTLVCGIRLGKSRNTDLKLNEMIEKIDRTKFNVKFLWFKHPKKKNAPRYSKKIRISEVGNDSRYVLLQFERWMGGRKSYDFKFRSELTHFKTLDDFNNFLLSICRKDYWKKLLKLSSIIELHLNLDFEAGIDFFTSCLSYRYSKDAKIMEGLVSKKKTFYLSRNIYFYEKYDGVIRFEKRYLGSCVNRMLGVRLFEDLFKISSFSQNPMNQFKFYNINRLKSKLTDYEKKVLNYFKIQYMTKDEKIIKCRKEAVRVTTDTFANAMMATNQRFLNDFSKRIIPKLFEIKLNFNDIFLEQSELFFKGKRNER